MTDFTPLMSFLGGTLIGVATVALMAVLGRIAGINGIASGFLTTQFNQDWAWRDNAKASGRHGSRAWLQLWSGTSGCVRGSRKRYARGCTAGSVISPSQQFGSGACNTFRTSPLRWFRDG